MIARDKEVSTVLGMLKRHPVVAIVGARQVGKTTLARMVATRRGEGFEHFDLENPEDLARLQDPMLALRSLTG